jgi:hypothetical protein
MESRNYNESINLLKLKNACVITVTGRSEKKKGIFIPIQENDLYVSLDESLNPKSITLSIASWALKEKGQYGDTHLLKQNFSKEFREQMSEEELRNTPILGNMRPMEKADAVSNVSSTEVQVPEQDDLPF